MKNNSKVHYKMYKAGKHWLFAAIATTIVTTGGFALNEAHADTTSAATADQAATTSTQTEQQTDTKSVSTTSTQTEATDQATTDKATEVSPADKTSDATKDQTTDTKSVVATNTTPAKAETKAEAVTDQTATNSVADKTATDTNDNKVAPVASADKASDANKAEATDQTTTTPAVDKTNDAAAAKVGPEADKTSDVTKAQAVDTTPTQTDVAAAQVTATNNQNMQLNTTNVNLAADQPAPASDVSVDVAAKVPSSDNSPYLPGNNIAYDITLKNGDNTGGFIPKGTKINFTIGTPTNGDMSKFISPAAINGGSDFDIVNNGDGSFVITTINDLIPGDYTFTLNFIAQDPGYNWDGKDPKNTNPTKVTAPVTVTYEYEGTTSSANFVNGDTIWILPRPYSAPPVDPQLLVPGFSSGNYNGITFPSNPDYPEGNTNFVGGAKDGTNIYIPGIKNKDGKSYVAALVTYNPSVNSSDCNYLQASSNLPFDLDNVFLYESDDNNTQVDVTNAQGIVWTKENNLVKASFPNGSKSLFGFKGLLLVVYVPVDNPLVDTPSITGDLNWFNANTAENTNSFWGNSYEFQPAGLDSTTPWFVGGDQTIYQNKQGDVTYAPMTGISAYDGTTGNLTDKVTITDLGGYPADGVNPAVGAYTITYSVTNDENVISTFSRVITVKGSEASVSGHDVTIYAGDAMPAASDFGATATADDGSAVPADQISIDTSKVNPNVAGDYSVTISADNGEVSTTVTVHVLTNQAKVMAHDVTIYTGETVPTDASAYGATAVGKDGTTPVAITSVDTSKVNNQVAATYPVVITDADGVSTTVNVIVLADQAKVTAHDVTIHTGDAVPTDASAYGATAVGKDGTTPVAISSVDTSKVDNQKVGTYPVVITDANGVSTTVNVDVVANQASISGQDVTIYAGDPMPADSAFKASATDEDGKAIAVTIDTSKVKPDIAGTYPVTITAADGQTKEVNVIVLADQAKVTAHDVTIHTGDAVPTDASAYGATAVGKDGTTPVAISSVDTSKVDNQKVGTYPVVITDADGVSTTVNVDVVANQASISGQDVTIYAGDAMPADSAFKASATDEDGKAIAVTIDTSKVNTQVAGTYPVTITAADGQTKEVSVIVLADQAKVTAHDVTIHTGDAVPTDASAYGAIAVGKDGTTPVVISSVDTSKVDNQKVGTYPVVITDADGVSTTVNVNVVANEASISGQDVTIYAGDSMPADSAFKASATDEDGKAIAVTIDTSKVNNQVAGTYPVTITAADGQTKEVSVIVLADQAKVTAHDVTIHTGDAVPTDASAYGATAVGKDGTTPVVISSVDTSKVDNQKVGTYPVVITDANGVSTTVNVNVVANEASISGQDVTIYAGDSMPADSAFKASATDEDGKDIAVTIDTSKVNNQVAGTYPVTITAADGQTKEVSVIVLADQAKVTAHDVTIHTGDAVPTDASAYGAIAVGKDGTTPVAISSVDTSKVDNQKVGTYPVVITDANGVSTTVNVDVVANEASISGQDVTIYAGDAMPADSAFKASATDEDGKAIAVTIDTSKVNTQVAGTYPVTITAADGQTKEVSVIVLADQAKVTAHDVTIHTGDAVPTDASAYGATAVGKDGTTPVVISSVDTSKVDNQKVGTYPVVITDADGVSTTVNVVVEAAPVVPTIPATPDTTVVPVEPTQPTSSTTKTTPVQPEQVATQSVETAPTATSAVKEGQPVTAPMSSVTPKADSQTPVAKAKKTTLPQTGQDATTSLMSIIGIILLSILGFFGLDGFKKKREDK